MDILNIVLSSLAIIIPSVLTIYQTKRSKSLKEITILIDEEIIIHKNTETPAEFRFFYKDIEFDLLSKAIIHIWNSGNKEIRGIDIPDKDKLRLEVNSFFCTKVYKQTNDTLSLPSNGNSVIIEFDVFNSGDGISFAIYHNSDKKIEVKGIVSGAKKVIVRGSRKLFKMQLFDKIACYMILLFPALFISSTLYDALIIKEQFTTGDIILNAFIILMALSSFFYALKKYVLRNPPKKIQYK